ncbi:hypothetical protein [Paraburkholderia sacchari]|uniref:hypothetical protein n=1 Tax=Paraburkholderia sacchari TaxID=159450 RepID=UPI000542ABF5|nr:hypothetical protein [Paraburkholderia sacchari]NLP64351.1 hypothetical protein [Paraburkholderia sacchari]
MTTKDSDHVARLHPVAPASKTAGRVVRLGPQYLARTSVARATKVADTSRLLRTAESVDPFHANACNTFGREHATACARLLGVAKRLSQVVDLELREQDGKTFVHCRVRGWTGDERLFM